MITVTLVVMLGAFLVLLPRLRGEEAGCYSPALAFLLIYVFLEYARPQTMYPGLDIIPWAKLTMVALLMSLLVEHGREATRYPLARRQTTLVSAFVGVAAVSIFVGIDAWTSVEVFSNLVKLALFYFVVSRVLDSDARLSAFIWTLLILNLKLALYHIRAFVNEVGYVGMDIALHRGRNVSIGFLGNAGDFGVAMCVVLPLALFVISYERHIVLKTLGVLSAATFIVAICATGSRGAFVGALAVATGAWLKMQRKVMALALLGAVGIVGLALAPGAYWNRMATIVGGSDTNDRLSSAANDTKRLRIELWKAGLSMALDPPFVGVGIGNFSVALDRRVRVPVVDVDVEGPDAVFFRSQLRAGALAPHNMFIQALSELGIAGLALIVWSFAASFYRHRLVRLVGPEQCENRRFTFGLAHALDLSLIGLAISGSFLTVLYYPHLWILLGLSVALTNVAVSNRQRDEQAVPDARPAGGRLAACESAA